MNKFLLVSFALLVTVFAFLAVSHFNEPIYANENAPSAIARLPVEYALLATDSQSSSLKFEVTVAAGLLDKPQNGRLFMVLGKFAQPEPRLLIGRTGMESAPVFARDVENFATGKPGVIDNSCVAFPIESLAKLPAGDYFIQALFDINNDLKSVNAPHNLYSMVQRATIDPTKGGTIKIELTQKIPEEQLPADSDSVKFVKIKSALLSKFHGRPIYLRAGIILPKDFAKEPSRQYPLRVHIGGYGSRFTGVQRMMSPGSEFFSAWNDDSTPKMIVLHLDGDGPFGDCYQVNSANNGPYGDAVTQELIPFVEQKFRGIGEPYARVLDGGSTGGWVSFALQVFYPDFFNGTWSYCPDGVDFRGFQLVNIYRDKNAYVNQYGFERPSAREINGETRFTIRHECQMENVLGAGDSWAMSGEQWGAWNATYGPRGADGRPRPLWHPKTGEIDASVVEHWKKYDLRLVLQTNWTTLAPKLKGKINIWVGEADNYFLNNAVHMLDEHFTQAKPSIEARIFYGAGKGHCWLGLTQRQMIDEMAARIEKSRSNH
ncbi:MAG: alpha/beta hydrolase-fold protein [Acidobacteriota bacterium]